MKKLLFASCLFTCLLISCSGDDDQANVLCDDFPLMGGNYNNAEDFDVLAAIAASLISQNTMVQTIHIAQETETIYSAQNVMDDLDARGIDYDTTIISDFGSENSSSAFFTNSPNPEQILLISEQELACLFLQDVNNSQLGFVTKYPNSFGLVTFSKPGISDNGQTAVVAFTSSTASNDDPIETVLEGGYFLMEKLGDQWTVEMKIVIVSS